MSKRTVFTTITPLSDNITRESVLQTLQNHVEMIDLNPLVVDRFRIKPPPYASSEEYHCHWYQLTDKITYVPGGAIKGRVTYNVCFHDLPYGLQTHCFAPLGLDIKAKWSIGGSLPGEARENQELGLGIPKDGGLYLREDVDMRCNIFATSFVKKTLKKAHLVLVERLVEKAHIREKAGVNKRLAMARMSSQAGCSHSTLSTNNTGESSSSASLHAHAYAARPGHPLWPPGYAGWQNSPELFYRNAWAANAGSLCPSLAPSMTTSYTGDTMTAPHPLSTQPHTHSRRPSMGGHSPCLHPAARTPPPPPECPNAEGDANAAQRADLNEKEIDLGTHPALRQSAGALPMPQEMPVEWMEWQRRNLDKKLPLPPAPVEMEG